jgi:plastocyanin
MIAVTPVGSRRMLRRMARILAVLMLLLAGCGEDGGPNVAPPTPLPTVTPEATDVQETTAPPTEECTDETITGNVQVRIVENDNAFSPSCIIVLGGQGLEILNKGDSKHNFSIEGTDVDLDTDPGDATRTEALSGVVDAGTHAFFCKYHRALGMVGELTLTEAG